MTDELSALEVKINALTDEALAKGVSKKLVFLLATDDVLAALEGLTATEDGTKHAEALLLGTFRALMEYVLNAQETHPMTITQQTALQTLGEYFQHAGDWKAARTCVHKAIERLR